MAFAQLSPGVKQTSHVGWAPEDAPTALATRTEVRIPSIVIA
jgi:hypothetical protein